MEYVLVYAKKWENLEKLSIEPISDATKKIINLTNQDAIRHFKAGVRVKCGLSGIIPKGVYKIKTMEVEYLNDIIFENGETQNEVDVKAKFSVSQEKIDKYIHDHLLFITVNKGLRRDVSESERTKAKSITDLLLDWGDNQDSEKELHDIFIDKVFDYAKPTKLITNLIKSTMKEESIVLDFFAGSGTTGHSVLELNKLNNDNQVFILCQMNENLDDALTTATDNAQKEIIQNQINLCNKIRRPHELSEIMVERMRRVMFGKSLNGNSNFPWIEDNEPYGGNLDVYEIADVANFESADGKTPFDVIDETLYGKEKFSTVKEKIDWVCQNFEKAQKNLE